MRFDTSGIPRPVQAVKAFLRQRRAKRRLFSPWFAWRPVSVGKSEWAWLETVERQERGGAWTGYVWLYRVSSKKSR